MASAPLVRGFGAGAAFAYRKGLRISVERFLADASRLAAALPDRRYLLNLCTDRYHFAVGFAAFLPRPIHFVEALPRNETGKLPRRALDEFESGLVRRAG